MIQHEIEEWLQILPTLPIELDGAERGVCLECLNPDLRSSAYILDTDPHGAIHPLITRLEHFIREYDEDAADLDDYAGPTGAELVSLELLYVNDTIRRALDLFIVPRVDAFVVDTTRYLDLRDDE
jgi:hypothetical protein